MSEKQATAFASAALGLSVGLALIRRKVAAQQSLEDGGPSPSAAEAPPQETQPASEKCESLPPPRTAAELEELLSHAELRAAQAEDRAAKAESETADLKYRSIKVPSMFFQSYVCIPL